MRVTFSFNSEFFFLLTLATKTIACCLMSADEKETLQFSTNHDAITATHVADMIIFYIIQYMKLKREILAYLLGPLISYNTVFSQWV